jgi:hypothetical protein
MFALKFPAPAQAFRLAFAQRVAKPVYCGPRAGNVSPSANAL